MEINNANCDSEIMQKCQKYFPKTRCVKNTFRNSLVY